MTFIVWILIFLFLSIIYKYHILTDSEVSAKNSPNAGRVLFVFLSGSVAILVNLAILLLWFEFPAPFFEIVELVFDAVVIEILDSGVVPSSASSPSSS